MNLSKAKRNTRRYGQLALIVAVLFCMGFALISTHQLNESIDMGNRNIVLNYGNQVAARLHDLFEQVDTGLGYLSHEIEAQDSSSPSTMQTYLEEYEEIWEMDVSGLLFESGPSRLSDGTEVVFENEISLRDVLSYSQQLNISRQNLNGEDMLVFTKPCKKQVNGQTTSGIFAAMKFDRLEELLGDYGYSSDSFLVLTQADGTNIWKQGEGQTGETGNCFSDLEKLTLTQGDSVLQMQTRMNVAMDGTIVYNRDDQDFYMAYVPLGVNYWYLLVSVRSDSIDLTELARQHFIISALLIAVILAMGAASIIYLTQRNRSMSQYNEQLEVAADLANEAYRANQANKAKQEFLAKVSHDIRTPLNGVVGMLTLAKEEYSDRERCLEHLDKASVSADYLLGLLNDVLNMSQIESGKQILTSETVDVKQLLKEISAILETSAGEKGLTFQMDDSALTHRYFSCDRLRLQQILMNLCSNAVKYTHVGGQILLKAEETEAGQVIFRVQDNGEGIAEDHLESIFQPFEQASLQRQGGVGLGLSIVRSFVELMDGTITVESRLGEGSTFIVTLPLQVAAEPMANQADSQAFDLHGVSILLAEDNEINAEITITLLERRGAKVALASDGEAVVAEFCRAPKGTYDVILMDIQMPKMNGLEATRAIRESNHPDAKTIPILSMTANAFHEQTDEMLEAGINDFLYKPIEIDLVCSCIIKWIRGE